MSYGTFLGQVFAARFPHRVGCVVLDGVLDPDETAKESGLHQVTQNRQSLLYIFLLLPSSRSIRLPLLHRHNTA